MQFDTADDRLASLLLPHAVPMETLHTRYGPLMELVRTLIGVVPNCDRYLEIWPPAFRTYNLVVPNLMNLPGAIFGIGGAPKALVGLAMVVASRTAECPYCTAHTCSFALRRGATPETVAQALLGGGGNLSAQELAVVAVARSLGRVPCELSQAERDELQRHFEPAEAEWIVMGAVAMGFLNKFMDAVSVELEASTVAEVTSTLGATWSAGKAGWALDGRPPTAPPPADSLRQKLRILRYLPTAISLDRAWQRGVPATWPSVGEYLTQHTGHAFPVLNRLTNPRCIRAIATVIKLNLDATQSALGLKTKLLAGAIFASVIDDAALAGDIAALAKHHAVAEDQLAAAITFARDPAVEPPAVDVQARAALLLARAASPSPAAVTADVINACRTSGLSAPAMVELVCWLSVLQLLHRLTAYFTE